MRVVKLRARSFLATAVFQTLLLHWLLLSETKTSVSAQLCGFAACCESCCTKLDTDDTNAGQNSINLASCNSACNGNEGDCSAAEANKRSGCIAGRIFLTEATNPRTFPFLSRQYCCLDNSTVSIAGCPATNAPTRFPTNNPTHSPTKHPSRSPTHSPTKHPTKSPSVSPTHNPTKSPTHSPTKSPTRHPTRSPSHSPTHSPTKSPTRHPTRSPSHSPTHFPTKSPTRHPTRSPSHSPTTTPTKSPVPPTFEPTKSPTQPTLEPTKAPTDKSGGGGGVPIAAVAGGAGGAVVVALALGLLIMSRRTKKAKSEAYNGFDVEDKGSPRNKPELKSNFEIRMKDVEVENSDNIETSSPPAKNGKTVKADAAKVIPGSNVPTITVSSAEAPVVASIEGFFHKTVDPTTPAKAVAPETTKAPSEIPAAATAVANEKSFDILESIKPSSPDVVKNFKPIPPKSPKSKAIEAPVVVESGGKKKSKKKSKKTKNDPVHGQVDATAADARPTSTYLKRVTAPTSEDRISIFRPSPNYLNTKVAEKEVSKTLKAKANGGGNGVSIKNASLRDDEL